MCVKCDDKTCLCGEKCGNTETGILIEDGTLSAFNLNTFDSTVKNK